MKPSFLALLIALAGVAFNSVHAAPDGAKIFTAQCAECHGPRGEGVPDATPNPLHGNRPLSGLTKYIVEKMPEDSPQDCAGEEAQAVAQYIYEAFYSPAAQVRNKKPRVDLARLTVNEYRHAVADLVGTFRPPLKPDDQRGLRAEYFNNPKLGDRKVERVDQQVDFDFGENEAAPGVGQEDFSTRWDGSLIAPASGEYEIVLQTSIGARLWLNNNELPLIDAWVRSGDSSQYRKTVFLLGGRAYPLRLEAFKSKREKTAAISLHWKRPHYIEEAIPAEFLAPRRGSEIFVVSTPFPPDDRSMGYERGDSVSAAWDEAATFAALETAGYIAAHLDQLTGSRSDSEDRRAKLHDFAVRFVQRAFRRPLSEDQRKFFIDRQFDASDDPAVAMKRIVLLTLKSPRFLYHEAHGGKFDAFDRASRISFALCDTLPDAPLLAAVANGQLETRQQVLAQVRRLLDDPRTHRKIDEFFHYWLDLERVNNVSKANDLYPEFNEQMVSDLRKSLDLFVHDIVWGEQSDFRQLLSAEFLYVNGRLAKFYGIELPEDAPFQKVPVDGQQRAGVLSHPLLMTSLAYHAASSPIHRGVFLARNILGRRLRPPPIAVAPTSPDLKPDLTTRERVVEQTRAQVCMSCHQMINPLGFSLENYDAVGRYRNVENDKPIDASGEYETLDAQRIEFQGAKDLAKFVANSEEAHSAFVERMLQHVVRHPILAYGAEQPERLREHFSSSGYSIRELLVEIVTTTAMSSGKSPTVASAN
ncbi:MAG: DUF1592 domain-containing protein [Planctomycetales bacterium]|nr:DUF1592 domain-containing protein [Planctomycetales bacterium]